SLQRIPGRQGPGPAVLGGDADGADPERPRQGMLQAAQNGEAGARALAAEVDAVEEQDRLGRQSHLAAENRGPLLSAPVRPIGRRARPRSLLSARRWRSAAPWPGCARAATP